MLSVPGEKLRRPDDDPAGTQASPRLDGELHELPFETAYYHLRLAL